VVKGPPLLSHLDGVPCVFWKHGSVSLLHQTSHSCVRISLTKPVPTAKMALVFSCTQSPQSTQETAQDCEAEFQHAGYTGDTRCTGNTGYTPIQATLATHGENATQAGDKVILHVGTVVMS